MSTVLPILSLLLGAPAGAQIWDGGRSAVRELPARRPSSFDSDLGSIDRSIRDGRRRGELSRSEARILRAESAMVARMARQARAGGPAWSDTTALDQRTRALAAQVAVARARPR